MYSPSLSGFFTASFHLGILQAFPRLSLNVSQLGALSGASHSWNFVPTWPYRDLVLLGDEMGISPRQPGASTARPRIWAFHHPPDISNFFTRLAFTAKRPPSAAHPEAPLPAPDRPQSPPPAVQSRDPGILSEVSWSGKLSTCHRSSLIPGGLLQQVYIDYWAPPPGGIFEGSNIDMAA